MALGFRRSSHLSRYLTALRLQRGIKPGQLAACLGATNLFKVGGLIRAFELGDPLSNHWLQKLVAELHPDPTELRYCLELDQAEAEKQLEKVRIVWESWADEPIEAFVSVRYSPGAGLTHKVPRAFCNSREQAEGWAADLLKRCPYKGILTWTRRERTCYDQSGSNPDRRQVTFEGRTTGVWMQVSESQQKFLLGTNGGFRPLLQPPD